MLASQDLILAVLLTLPAILTGADYLAGVERLVTATLAFGVFVGITALLSQHAMPRLIDFLAGADQQRDVFLLGALSLSVE